MLKVYDKVTYRFGEIIDAETTEQGESWILVRWNSSPWYPDWIDATDDRYSIIDRR